MSGATLTDLRRNEDFFSFGHIPTYLAAGTRDLLTDTYLPAHPGPRLTYLAGGVLGSKPWHRAFQVSFPYTYPNDSAVEWRSSEEEEEDVTRG